MATQEQFTEKDWNRLRTAFSVSIMVDTPLLALAQNVNAPDWPIPGDDERPSKYLDYSWTELHVLPGLREDPARVQQLLRILADTLAFDEPFQQMVEQGEKSTETEYAALRTLQKLGIPEDFPIALTSLSLEAKEFCKSQGFKTLGEFTRLSQKISQFVIMEGDFRAFLNALSHLDERTISRYLPFRPGARGVHLAEAIGHQLRALPEPEFYALARQAGARISRDQADLADAVTRDRVAALDGEFRDGLLRLLEYFKDETRDWRTQNAGVFALDYRLRVLNDPLLETTAYRLIKPIFDAKPTAPAAASAGPAPAAAAASNGERPGFFSRLLRRMGIGR